MTICALVPFTFGQVVNHPDPEEPEKTKLHIAMHNLHDQAMAVKKSRPVDAQCAQQSTWIDMHTQTHTHTHTHAHIRNVAKKGDFHEQPASTDAREHTHAAHIHSCIDGILFFFAYAL